MADSDQVDAEASTQDTEPTGTASTDPSTQTSTSSVTTASQARRAALEAKQHRLQATLAELQAERDQLLLTRSKEEANAIVKEHISLLTKYNEIKDVGQGLMGLIAEQKGCRVAEVMKDFDVAEDD